MCRDDFVEKVRHFHVEFVSSKSYLVPQAIREFFISLCFEVSAECKSFALKRLSYDTSGKVTDEDYAPFEAAAKSRKEPVESNDTLLANDIKALLEEDFKDIAIMFSRGASAKIRDMMRVCRAKLEPFYSKLVVPLVKLAKLGYYYEESSENGLLADRWYNIVKVCESFAAIDSFEGTANLVKESKSLTNVTANEANELYESQGSLYTQIAEEV